VIPTDPALDYPPGEPDGLLLVALSVAGFVLARRLGEASRGWAAYCRISGTLVIAFAAGLTHRLDVQGILRQAPAGLLEHALLLIGFCWIAASRRPAQPFRTTSMTSAHSRSPA